MKYKLLDRESNGLCRIQALIDIPSASVEVGDLGGYVQSAENLAQTGRCWVSGNALVFGNAQVSGNALVSGNARVSDNALVSDNAHVYGSCWVSDSARVFGDAQVTGNAHVSGIAQVSGYARVSGDTLVNGQMECSKTPLVISGLSQHVITVVDNLVSVGCEVHTIDEWLEKAESIGTKNNYSKKQIAEYLSTFKYIKFMIDNYSE